MLILALVVLVLAVAGWAASDSEVVLGSKTFVPFGKGWGTAQPRFISNGGVPSGVVLRIHWESWGSREAVGRGLTWIYRPHGGYYPRPGAIELRASRIGRCSPSGPRAYRRLRARVPSRPGRPLGRWFTWGGQRNLCRWS